MEQPDVNIHLADSSRGIMIKVVICDVRLLCLQPKPSLRTRAALWRSELTTCPSGFPTRSERGKIPRRGASRAASRRTPSGTATKSRARERIDSKEEAPRCPLSASLLSQDSQSSFRGIMAGRRRVCAITTPCFVTSAHTASLPAHVAPLILASLIAALSSHRFKASSYTT